MAGVVSDFSLVSVAWALAFKFSIVIGPNGVAVWVHEQQFEIVECCPLEEGECVIDLVCVKLKYVRSVVEVELQLN